MMSGAPSVSSLSFYTGENVGSALVTQATGSALDPWAASCNGACGAASLFSKESLVCETAVCLRRISKWLVWVNFFDLLKHTFTRGKVINHVST